MALPFYKWSLTAASNATADSTVNWSEGMAPAAVNDSARAMMASIAAFRDDRSGFVQTGGTSTAYTYSSRQVFDSLAHMNGHSIAFNPHTTNGAFPTLNVDGLGAMYITDGVGNALPAGTLISSTPYTVTYYNGSTVFVVNGFYGNPYNIPIGGSLDYWGTTAPNSSFVFPSGQAISRSTYSTLFALFSTTYGVGDGSSTFNIPDLRGRVTAGKDDMGGSAASRLTPTYFGTSAAALGAAGGAESKTLGTSNLPAYTPSGSVANGAVTINNQSSLRNIAGDNNNGGGGGGLFGAVSSTPPGLTASQAGSTFTGTAQGGTSDAFSITQPSIICNKILRII